jgi:hypothetical protein
MQRHLPISPAKGSLAVQMTKKRHTKEIVENKQAPPTPAEQATVDRFLKRREGRLPAPHLTAKSKPNQPVAIGQPTAADILGMMLAFGTTEPGVANLLLNGLINAACEGSSANPPSEEEINRALTAVHGHRSQGRSGGDVGGPDGRHPRGGGPRAPATEELGNSPTAGQQWEPCREADANLYGSGRSPATLSGQGPTEGHRRARPCPFRRSGCRGRRRELRERISAQIRGSMRCKANRPCTSGDDAERGHGAAAAVGHQLPLQNARRKFAGSAEGK